MNNQEVTPAVDDLTRRGIDHRVVSYNHDPTASSFGLEAVEALGLDPETVFKTLLASIDRGSSRGQEHVVAVVPVTHQLDLKALAAATGGKRAAMADPAAAQRSTGYVLGGISPIGQKKKLATYIDQSATSTNTMYVSGGRRGLEIAIAPADLVAVLEATVCPLTSHP